MWARYPLGVRSLEAHRDISESPAVVTAGAPRRHPVVSDHSAQDPHATVRTTDAASR